MRWGEGTKKKRRQVKEAHKLKNKNVSIYRHDYLCLKFQTIYKKVLESIHELSKISGYKADKNSIIFYTKAMNIWKLKFLNSTIYNRIIKHEIRINVTTHVQDL